MHVSSILLHPCTNNITRRHELVALIQLPGRKFDHDAHCCFQMVIAASRCAGSRWRLSCEPRWQHCKRLLRRKTRTCAQSWQQWTDCRRRPVDSGSQVTFLQKKSAPSALQPQQKVAMCFTLFCILKVFRHFLGFWQVGSNSLEVSNVYGRFVVIWINSWSLCHVFIITYSVFT